MSALIDIRHLTTVYETRAGVVKAVDDISFAVARGETLALVGESGSGKSNAVLSILGLIQSPGKISQGEILFDGDDLLSLSEEDFRRLRGNRISMVFQDPMTALNPLLSLGRQLRDIVMQHLGMNRAQAALVLRISEHTLRVYIESARNKLGALNTTHAVARALSYGLIVV